MYLPFEKIEQLLQDQIRFSQDIIKRIEALSGTNQKDFFTIEEVSDYLNLAKQTVYGLVSRGEIPYIKKGNRLYFLRSEILDWLRQGRRPTRSEKENSAVDVIDLKKGGVR